MFYKQTVDNIKVVILSLDGGILDLNRLRFNYLKKYVKYITTILQKKNLKNHLVICKLCIIIFRLSKILIQMT